MYTIFRKWLNWSLLERLFDNIKKIYYKLLERMYHHLASAKNRRLLNDWFVCTSQSWRNERLWRNIIKARSVTEACDTLRLIVRENSVIVDLQLHNNLLENINTPLSIINTNLYLWFFKLFIRLHFKFSLKIINLKIKYWYYIWRWSYMFYFRYKLHKLKICDVLGILQR